VFTIVFFVVFLIISVWGIAQVKDGLDLTEVVPRDTSEYHFLEKQSKYFGYYNIYLVTKEFDYPHNQRLLREYHAAFSNVKHILREKNGNLPMFWLDAFRSWLVGMSYNFLMYYLFQLSFLVVSVLKKGVPLIFCFQVYACSHYRYDNYIKNFFSQRT